MCLYFIFIVNNGTVDALFFLIKTIFIIIIIIIIIISISSSSSSIGKLINVLHQ